MGTTKQVFADLEDVWVGSSWAGTADVWRGPPLPQYAFKQFEVRLHRCHVWAQILQHGRSRGRAGGMEPRPGQGRMGYAWSRSALKIGSERGISPHAAWSPLLR